MALVGVAVALLFALLWVRARRRMRAAEQAERSAVERRDRFLATVASELDMPLQLLRDDAAPTLWPRIDRLRAVLAELGQRPMLAQRLDELDLGELVREIVEAPPFSDGGPPVILRAGTVRVVADRGRLATGLRLLLWVVRREVDERAPLVLTVSAPDGEHALLEIDARGAALAVDALAKLGAINEGLIGPVGQPGTTLALRVAHEVARVHHGRLQARTRAGEGERFVLELPATA